MQECPLEYPEHDEGTNEDDADDEDNEYKSDDDQDDEDEDTYDEDGNIINISGKINPVVHTTHYEDTGEVPSPKKFWDVTTPPGHVSPRMHMCHNQQTYHAIRGKYGQ